MNLLVFLCYFALVIVFAYIIGLSTNIISSSAQSSTWYVGKGALPNTYYTYQIQNVNADSGQPIIVGGENVTQKAKPISMPSNVSPSNLVSIVQGSSSPNNQKFYEPSVANLTVGGTVTWINKDTTVHTVTSISNDTGGTSNAFNSKTLLPGQTFRHMFNHVGTFDYYCTIHPFMKGQVVVSETTKGEIKNKQILSKILPSLSIENRHISLSIEINPPFISNTSKQNGVVRFRLFNTQNNETIHHVTYELTIIKGLYLDQKPQLSDFFHAHNGLLTLKIQPANGNLTIYGQQDPSQNAWVADPVGIINMKGPVLLVGGWYHFDVKIFGIDNDTHIFIPDNAPEFDTPIMIPTG